MVFYQFFNKEKLTCSFFYSSLAFGFLSGFLFRLASHLSLQIFRLCFAHQMLPIRFLSSKGHRRWCDVLFHRQRLRVLLSLASPGLLPVVSSLIFLPDHFIS
ncbi:uncharacterized protein BYT42DRAFT_225520 [Radiomyces spectabilis]|uniref:uncharacterized protein n=1 Tax=Radiomyces spectabilis TaxID=64574 RepID=UPI0022204A2D|nr:uncharacterized protein BYT42DRAFT_225520 [Radiomyces spectabilis]KAI8388194.1 hypothetical protein BYT42DRAFT_225520 [Radiomyces spectabilis]